ncbi:MAG: DUF2807 domain-containing protein [Sphingobacteriaceae bacterium]|nr:MAG: DUF2807 domain-containing protein [Sphingobacteriaceae bacterium]
MKSLLTTVALLVALVATAQTKTYTDANAKTRTLSGSFSKVSVASGVELYLTQGNEEALAVSVSDSKYEERFKTEIENGTLKIWYDNKNWSNSDKNRKLKAYVSYKTLEALTCSSGSNTKLTNTLNTGTLALNFSSGCVFDGAINATNVTTNANSGAMVKISGKAEKLKIEVSSGANFKGDNLATSYCTASANSGGSIGIEVQKELNASANSGGDIRYTGAAVLNKGSINSGGSVKQRSK